MEDKDIKHLEWVYERMKHIHNESENYDYMIRFREILEALRQPTVSSSCFLEVIDKLPHSKSRVPYTYHHDYLRQHSRYHNEMSRADIASSHTADDIELYAIALTQLLNELGAKIIYYINSTDVLICKKAKEITDAAISRYNCC